MMLAAGYTGWLISQFDRVMRVIHVNPDAAWAPVLVADMATGTSGGKIFVGEASHLTTIWFLMLTRSFPFRDVLWDWAPYLTFLAGLGLTAWACKRVAGVWPAMLTLALGASATATVLLTVMAEGIRGNTFFAVSFLAFALVWLDETGGGRLKTAGMWALVVLVAGSTLASDPLFLAVGLGPLVGAPVVVWLVDRSRQKALLALGTLASAGAAVAVSSLIWRVMAGAGFQKNYLTEGYSFATPQQMLTNAGEFATHVLALTNGYVSGQPGLNFVPARIAMTGVVLAAAGYGVSLFVRLILRRRADERIDTALVLYVAFWLLSAAGTFAAFAVSTFPAGPSDSSRYVIPVFFALAAVAPLVGRNRDWGRVAAAAGAIVFCVLSIASREEVFAYERVPGFRALMDEGPAIIEFVQSEGATKGYGGYFTSHQLTLMSDLEVYVLPVIACHQPDSDRLCPFSVNSRTAWYEPEAGIKSFILQDTVSASFIAPGPPADLGPPSAVEQFGSLTVTVFDYDVAATFAPPCLRSQTFTCPPK